MSHRSRSLSSRCETKNHSLRIPVATMGLLEGGGSCAQTGRMGFSIFTQRARHSRRVTASMGCGHHCNDSRKATGLLTNRKASDFAISATMSFVEGGMSLPSASNIRKPSRAANDTSCRRKCMGGLRKSTRTSNSGGALSSHSVTQLPSSSPQITTDVDQLAALGKSDNNSLARLSRSISRVATSDISYCQIAIAACLGLVNCQASQSGHGRPSWRAKPIPARRCSRGPTFLADHLKHAKRYRLTESIVP